MVIGEVTQQVFGENTICPDIGKSAFYHLEKCDSARSCTDIAKEKRQTRPENMSV